MKKLLFICNQGQHRSKTAETIFKDRYETKSAGLFNENPITKDQINWADIIFVMEDAQRTEIAKRFPEDYMKKQIICLSIPDIYQFNHPELINLLKNKVNNILNLLTTR